MKSKIQTILLYGVVTALYISLSSSIIGRTRTEKLKMTIKKIESREYGKKIKNVSKYYIIHSDKGKFLCCYDPVNGVYNHTDIINRINVGESHTFLVAGENNNRVILKHLY